MLLLQLLQLLLNQIRKLQLKYCNIYREYVSCSKSTTYCTYRQPPILLYYCTLAFLTDNKIYSTIEFNSILVVFTVVFPHSIQVALPQDGGDLPRRLPLAMRRRNDGENRETDKSKKYFQYTIFFFFAFALDPRCQQLLPLQPAAPPPGDPRRRRRRRGGKMRGERNGRDRRCQGIKSVTITC